jgi:hypothetical protein
MKSFTSSKEEIRLFEVTGTNNHKGLDGGSRSAACSPEVEITSTPGANADNGTLTLTLTLLQPAFPAMRKQEIEIDNDSCVSHGLYFIEK